MVPGIVPARKVEFTSPPGTQSPSETLGNKIEPMDRTSANLDDALSSPDEGFPGSVPAVESELLVATFSESGDTLYCNDPWTSLLGPPEEPWAHLSEQERERAESAVLEACNGALVTNQLVSVETHSRDEPLPILFNFIPMYDGSDEDDSYRQGVTASGEVLAEPPSWMISQTKRHRLETLGRMTMGVAHDLNNLLSSLIGHIELLREQVEPASLTSSIRPSIETIETSAQDGAALIEKLQRYIRHDTQQHFEPVDPTTLIRDCITLTEPYWRNEPRRQGIEISMKTDFEEVPNILGSASELREVIVNLILNAVQAMPEGGTIRFRTFTSDEGHACIEVSDTGIGMSDEVQQNIFEPLFTTKGEDGTGMGLAASYGIIQEHEGMIDITSEPGEGTQFTLTFPPAEGDPSPVEKSSTDSPEAEGASVLVVDDEERVRSTVSRLLSLNDHDIDCASTGPEALQMFEKGRHDIVFTDFGMLEMTGTELAQELKETNPDLPVILLTGYTEAETDSQEVDDVVSKPFSGDELQATIRKHVAS